MAKTNISLQSEGLKLTGEVYFPYSQDGEPSPALCLCHGIPGGGPPYPGDPGYPALAARFSRAGFITTIFNFRGTGGSEGNFDIAGWTNDLMVVLDYLYTMSDVNRRKISVMGFSAGAAVSVYVASQDSRVSSLIICACPTQFRFATNNASAESAIKQFRDIGIIREKDFPTSVADWIAGFNKVRPIDWIENISPRPLLIIQGTNDDVIDPASGRVLYERAGEPKEILLVEGAGHRLRLEEQAMDSAIKWLTGQAS